MNLIDLLFEKSKNTNNGITFIESNDKEDFLSYSQLKESSLQVLSFLQSKGIQPKDELVFQIEDSKVFIILFWACILGGIIPIPLTLGVSEDQRQKLLNIWKNLDNPYLIISGVNLLKLEKYTHAIGLDTFNSIHAKVIDVADIFSVEKNVENSYYAESNSIAYIQFSSGSTGIPKGVILTHENLITNIKAILRGIKSPENGDSFFSWLPLTHDMGLIGFHLTPLFAGWHHYIMPTSLFIRRPSLWLEKISQHRISFTASPNFGYRYVVSRMKEDLLMSLDLSCLRVIVNGAEPISEALCEVFYKAFSPYGLRRNVIFPVYGLAEASLAVTFTDPSDLIGAISIDRKKMGIGDHVIKVDHDEGLVVVNVGKPIDNCSVRIVNQENCLLGNLRIGQIQIKGGNVTPGYYNNIDATKIILSNDGWLNTGDLGFFNDGSLFVTGRIKDVFFINGINYYSHDIERVLESVQGIELGKVVVVGFTNAYQVEEVLIFILFKGKLKEFSELIYHVKMIVNKTFGFYPDNVIHVREIPKTTSGKIQRYKLVEMYINGEFDKNSDVLEVFTPKVKLLKDSVGSGSNIEKKVIRIWSAVLGHQNFDVTDKFFEIGGNSLKGAQVLSMIHSEFNIELDYNILFERQTVLELLEEITDKPSVPFSLINKIKEKDLYQLASAQKRLYYIWEADKSSIAYNIPLGFKISGELNFERLEQAIKELIKIHEVLRTNFFLSNHEPVKSINKNFFFSLKVTDVEEGQLDFELRKKIQPFDLLNDQLFKLELLKLSSENYICFFDIHHIIADGISVTLFLKDLFNIYSGQELQSIDIQYKDYTSWEFENQNRPKLIVSRNYWIDKLKDNTPILNLPVDYPRPLVFDHSGEKLKFSMGKILTSDLKIFAKQQNTSLFILLLSAYYVLLSKYTDQEDIIIGVPVANRNHIQLQKIIGMFVNNLALRNSPKGNLSFLQFLRQVRENTFSDFNHQDYPFGELVKDIGLKRDVSRNALFDTMFVYQNMDFPEISDSGLFLQNHFFDTGSSKFDITLEIIEGNDYLEYYFEYSTSLFSRETIKRLAGHFENLLIKIIKTPEVSLSEISLLSNKDYHHQILGFNNNRSAYPEEKLLYELVEEQMLKTPLDTALLVGELRQGDFEDKGVTYKDLSQKVDQIANYLLKLGLANSNTVAVILDRTPDLVASILAILKVGGCYVPISKDLPHGRISYILNDCKAIIIITDTEGIGTSNFGINLEHKVEELNNYKIINIDETHLYANTSKLHPIRRGRPDDNAYIIYTSGTTGNPKGTMISHQSLINYLSWAKGVYVSEKKAAFPLYTSISFDLTITSIFLPLITGNTIVTYPGSDNYLLIEKILSDNHVDVLKATPSHLKILKELLPRLRSSGYESKIKTIIAGGEMLTTQLANDILTLFKGDVKIFNEYGPTEATVGCMIYVYNVQSDKRLSVPIGVPINNTSLYILDKYLKPIPQGVVGELYIAGSGLSKGYLFNKELTNSKFIANPFQKEQIMYKSGDLVRMLPSGNIEYLGRQDRLVKINGYRIELGEIEEVLLTHSRVGNAVVFNRLDERSDGFLSAYICEDSQQKAEGFINEEISFIDSVKSFLVQRLPHYLIPRFITVIDKIPLTLNGKVDEEALPIPVISNGIFKVPPRNRIEKIMTKVWEEILSVTDIGITDNFFELGGDSIKAVQISSRLLDNDLSVKPKTILAHQTIEQLCRQIDIQPYLSEFEQGLVYGEIGLNPIQHWFFEHKFTNLNFYNQSILLKFEKKLTKEIVEKVIKTIIERHDGLRLNFDMTRKTMYFNNYNLDLQAVEEYRFTNDLLIINKENGVEPDRLNYDNKNLWSLSEKLKATLIKIKSSFDITNSLLIKSAIFKDNNTNLLFLTAHHLVVDAVSWRIFLDDFYEIYHSLENSGKLNPRKKTASLIDCHNKYMTNANNSIANEVDFWKENGGSDFRISDKSKATQRLAKNITRYTSCLSYEDTNFLLKDAHNIYNTNIEILLMLALLKTLKQWTNQSEITVETENHGRHLDDIDTSRTIGWFTSIYPMKFCLDEIDMGMQIKYVKEKLKAIPNGGMGYGILKYMTKRLGELQYSTDVRFNYLGQFNQEVNNDTFSFIDANLGLETDVSNQLDLAIDFNAMIINERLQIYFDYDRDIFNEKKMNEFVEKYKNNIFNISNHIKGEDKVHLTSSDFDGVKLDDHDLKTLFG